MNAFDDWFFSRYAGEEELHEVYHRHIFSILDNVAVWTFFGVLAPFYLYYADVFHVSAYLGADMVTYWFLLVYAFLMYRIFDWYNDVWILTGGGLIDLDWSVFGRRTQHIEYHDIAGLEVVEGGMLDSLIGRADVVLRTHAEGTEFELSGARDPYAVVEGIQEALDSHRLPEPEPELTPYERLLSTLEDVVREHLERQGKPAEPPADDEEISVALSRPGTIDLRPKRASDEDVEDLEEAHGDAGAHH